MTNDETRGRDYPLRHWAFVILSSFVIRPSSLLRLRQVPKPYRLIRSDRRQPRTLRQEDDALHPRRVAFQRLDRLAVRRVPQPNRAVLARGDQQRAARMKS